MKSLKLAVMFFLVTAPLMAEVTVEARNTLPVERKGGVVEVKWSELACKEKGITAENVRVLDGKTVLRSQAVDNDGDGKIDELVFAADFPAGATRSFVVKADEKLQIPDAPEKVYARYVPERKDDFAWENDKVGFRAYGPGLRDGVENCGFDCFMKRVNYPIIDNWYGMEKKGQSYHLDYGEGQDAYKVGASLGCGGSAVWKDGKLFTSEVYTKWRRFASGPLRAVFELDYGPWDVVGQSITETKRITLDLGSRLFRVDDRFMSGGKPARLDVAVGVTTHENKAEGYGDAKAGWLYAWEKIDSNYLGTGVIAPPEVIKEYKLIDSKKKDEGHGLFVIDSGEAGTFSYWAGFAWEKQGEITSREQWENYLKSFIEQAKSPLQVTVK